MAQFDFKLEAVLRHRVQIERECQRELASRQAVLTQFKQEIAQLEQTAHASLEDLRTNHLTGRIDVSFLTAHRRYMLSMQRKTHAIAQKMMEAQACVEDARLRLVEASRNRKMLEKLREKHHLRWREAQEKKELADADEIGTRLAFGHLTEVREER